MAESVIPRAEFRVLLALADGPKHGHGIRVEVLEGTGGRVDLGPGTLYGAIKRLDRRGWIEEIAPPPGEDRDGRRRFYRLSPDGRVALRAEVARLGELLAIAESKALRLAAEG